MEKILLLTDAAKSYLKNALKNEDALGVRIDVETGGCKGMTYSINFIKEINSADILFKEDDLQIYIASKAVLFIAGMTMDYVQTLIGSNIVFENPNASGKCGCGKSFCVQQSSCEANGSSEAVNQCQSKCCGK